MKQRLLSIAFVFLSVCAYAQSNDWRYEVESGLTVATGEHTPFWLVNGKYGLSSIERNNGYVRAGVSQHRVFSPRWSYKWEVELAAAHRFTSSFIVQQAYLDVRYRFLELSVGSKERFSELKNDALSSGGLILSTHARPVPQVRFALPEFVPLFGRDSWLHVKGHVAYGRFTDDGFQKEFTQGKQKYTQNALYHSKALFLKIANRKIPFSFTAGLEMVSQFGGECYYPNGKVQSTPHKFIDFFKILIPSSGDSGASMSDQINILGNHLGSYHLAMEYRSPTWDAKVYWEHPFDDPSGMETGYGMWEDCIVGVELTLPKNRFIESLVVEYLYTKDQCGAFHFMNNGGSIDWGDNYTGADNYYNNGQYTGWAHWGMALGNPLLTSPIYNRNNSLDFLNNRVEGFHVGWNGEPFQGLRYRVLFSTSRNWGTYGTPFDDIRTNWNGLAEVTYAPSNWKGWSFTLSGAADAGNLLNRSVGCMLKICKKGGFKL